VPQVGQAVCGSFGLRQFGQTISCGAVVFHCARRDLVLLRDIFRLGTATSVLLSLSRHGIRPRCRYFILALTAGWLLAIWLVGPKVLQRGPHSPTLLMPVSGLGIGQPDATLDAQALAPLLAQGRERQLEHDRVAQRPLQVQQTAAVQPVAVLRVRSLGLRDLGSPYEQLLESHRY
jgi:hypothetical protein